MINKRMCVACRQRKTKSELVRISSENNIAVIDQNKKQKNRAIYVCKDKNCVEMLKKSNAIKRMLNVIANDELYKNIIM